ncbi:MAG: protein adenylyltransferase SelO [Nocardioides sp.]
MGVLAERWGFDNTYARDLEGFYVATSPAEAPDPGLLLINEPLAVELGLDPERLRSAGGLAVLAGNAVPEDANPLAQAYAGHQFGQFVPMLGDGRALVLGEVVDQRGRRRDISLKGSGRTPFSRGGDGRAVTTAVLREYIVSEAMHALGIPTTRALAAVGTGQRVIRDRPEPGAILTRVAASHLRVGTFELVRSRGSLDHLRQLGDYAIARHHPAATGNDPPARELLAAVVTAQAELIAAWMSVGFVHGVMNTDNMTISGETIDYGPCAFVESYDQQAVFSSIDTAGRYRFGNQPAIGAWNLSRLAEALLPLLADDADDAVRVAEAEIERYFAVYDASWRRRMSDKLGLSDEEETDPELIDDLLGLLAAAKTDYTSAWRALADDLRGAEDAARGRLPDPAPYHAWRRRWLARLGDRDLAAVADRMDTINPLYLPRNHLVEEALEKAREGDLRLVHDLLDAVARPYQKRPELSRYAEPAPLNFTENFVTYCGT